MNHHPARDESAWLCPKELIRTVQLWRAADRAYCAVQLQPLSLWRDAEKNAYTKSFLQRLAERDGVRSDHNMMTVQYRMHPKLSDVVSNTFYDGRLLTARSVTSLRRRSTPVLFIEVEGQEQRKGHSFWNPLEVERVVEVRARAPGGAVLCLPRRRCLVLACVPRTCGCVRSYAPVGRARRVWFAFSKLRELHALPHCQSVQVVREELKAHGRLGAPPRSPKAGMDRRSMSPPTEGIGGPPRPLIDAKDAAPRSLIDVIAFHKPQVFALEGASAEGRASGAGSGCDDCRRNAGP